MFSYQILAIATRKEHLLWATRFFAACQSVVVEEFLRVKKNFCVQFAKTIKGEIRYLGTTEQITNAAGIYVGNWQGKEVIPPKRSSHWGVGLWKGPVRWDIKEFLVLILSQPMIIGSLRLILIFV